MCLLFISCTCLEVSSKGIYLHCAVAGLNFDLIVLLIIEAYSAHFFYHRYFNSPNFIVVFKIVKSDYVYMSLYF